MLKSRNQKVIVCANLISSIRMHKSEKRRVLTLLHLERNDALTITKIFAILFASIIRFLYT